MHECLIIIMVAVVLGPWASHSEDEWNHKQQCMTSPLPTYPCPGMWCPSLVGFDAAEVGFDVAADQCQSHSIPIYRL